MYLCILSNDKADLLIEGLCQSIGLRENAHSRASLWGKPTEGAEDRREEREENGQVFGDIFVTSVISITCLAKPEDIKQGIKSQQSQN